jgi:hypothetical protein
MLNLKKTAVAVLALGSSAAFAGTMGPVCTPGNVTVPCEMTAWDVGVQALYLQPVSALDTNVDINGVGNNNNDRNWQWGFKADVAYHFSTGNDINLNWYHLTNDAHRDHFTSDPLLGGFTYRVEPRWDEANAEIGQHVDFSEHSRVRFHGGVQYSRVAHDIRVGVLSTNDRFVGGLSANNGSTSFNGFGPRVGADLSYDFGNGFSLYGNGASALLVGTSRQSAPLALAGSSSLSHTSLRLVVPQVEGKLGMKYDYALAKGVIGLDAGYMWVDYINVENFNASSNDFAVHGAFFGAKWIGNV